ncbi:Enolase, C-terminal TIM barrel domain-containing protein [Xylogone sp. PMI_703]|nr:Enolase, C-terminal TIM barrel domain-containing protein [Xylogone sp. PMI_703]
MKSISAAQRLDSRGKPTVQVCVKTENGVFKAIVPSGASKGDYEACELRDEDSTAYGGNGVLKAVHNVENVIAPALLRSGFDVGTELRKIDALMRELDGTPDKTKLGANAILAVSMACARAGAAAQNIPLYEFLRRSYVLPVPFFNVLNGGVHSMITDRKPATGIGDEGGFAPPISKPQEALELLTTAVANCNYTGQIKFAIDPASSEFFHMNTYNLGFKGQSEDLLSPRELSGLYRELMNDYPLVLLEDPFAQDDWPSWTAFNADCPIELVGDDLLATNIRRLEIAQEKQACNSMLLKINQIGTISEAIDAACFAYKLGWSVFVSHRSGESTDDFIADLTVALGSGHLKSGAPCRGERVAKYNRLMDIEDELLETGEKALYAGLDFRYAHQQYLR